MGKKMNIGCGSSKTIKDSEEVEQVVKEEQDITSKGEQNMIRVGKPAPSFTAQAFYKGEFTEVSLEDYRGKWVLLCFYPGDFTFV